MKQNQRRKGRPSAWQKPAAADKPELRKEASTALLGPATQPDAQPQDALLAQLLKMRPVDGEDYHVFSVVIDDPQFVSYEQRLSVAGSYETAAAQAVQILGLLAQVDGLKRGARIELFQGDRARQFLARGVLEETRYQQMRRSQPNN